MPSNPKSASSFLQLIRRSERGRLKIYLGYGPGVGKTYLMLQEGHRLKKEGIDVVVGYVETHGRAETAALVEGLEVVARRSIDYRNIVLEEMDTEAIIARRPQVALVDELAHTNPPGNKNAKRFMDVEDLLAAGIHVISTMNVQHLESLYNTVEELVNVRVAERLPDVILKQADEIVNVDVSPEDLIHRLQSGKIYPQERIATAAENYFQSGNLTQLRELTLREAASQLDFKRRERPPESVGIVPDQVMVCLSASGSNNAHLLRYGSRLAGRLNRRWYAVHVQTSKEDPLRIDPARQRMLSETMTLANQLGAMVFTFKGNDVVNTILRFAREYRVGHIVVGRPRPQKFLKRLIRERNTVELLIEKASGFRIVVLDERLPDIEPVEPVKTVSTVPFISGLPPKEKENKFLSELSEQSIVIWNEPLTKQQVINNLLETIAKQSPKLNVAVAREAVMKREEEISTFLNEGVAVPHARLDSLDRVCFALGITKSGVKDAAVGKPTESVFMALYPADQVERYLEMMGSVATLLRNRRVREQLKTCSQASEVLQVLKEASL